MTRELYDKFRNLKKKDGEKTDSLHRDLVEEKEKELLRDGKVEEFLLRVFDIEPQTKPSEEGEQQSQDGGQ